MSTNTDARDLALWNETELSERLGIPERTIRGWRTRGGGPHFIKLGAAVRYRPATVAAWLDQLERETTAGSAG